MNCVNHPEAAVSAWCQNCGKALCSECVRNDQGNVFCQECLAARVPGSPSPYPPGVAPPAGANPALATVLGFIPGVGAMYNGQYIKAIVHVLVFVVLVGLSGHANGLFGILVAFWVIYQIFDAHQTAKARRDGLPLPDPFGLNELGNAIGGHAGPRPVPPPVPPPPGAAPSAAYSAWAEQMRSQAHGWGQQAGQWGEQLRQRIVAEAQAGHPFTPGSAPGPTAAGFAPTAGNPAGPAATGYPPPPGYAPPAWGPPPPVPPVPPAVELQQARREPLGAILLILLGMLFLFNTLGFFSFSWIGHGWPWIVVAIAVWLLVRGRGTHFHMHPVHPPAPPQDSPQPPAGGGQ